jgi:hypothetical protein
VYHDRDWKYENWRAQSYPLCQVEEDDVLILLNSAEMKSGERNYYIRSD